MPVVLPATLVTLRITITSHSRRPAGAIRCRSFVQVLFARCQSTA